MRFLTHLSTVIYSRGDDDDDRFPSWCRTVTGGGGGVFGYDCDGGDLGRSVRTKEFHLHGGFFFLSAYIVDGVNGGS